MNTDTFSIFIILFIIVISYRIYHNSDLFQLKCIISDVDGNTYCVRERNKIAASADRLAQVNKNMLAVIKHCTQNFPNDENVIRMKKGYNPKKIVETLPTSKIYSI